MTDEGTPGIPLQPDPRLLEAADFLVIAANAPHLFQAEIERANCWPRRRCGRP